MRIVIGAAAGNIGRRVAEHVLQAGGEAVLLVRNPTSLPAAVAAHAQAQVVTLDLTDEGAVVAAAQGADALFWLVPPPPLAVSDWPQWYQAIAAAGAAAVRTHQIAHVVLVSSLGAGMAPGLGTVSYVGELEQQLNATGAHVVALRPGYFMENFLAQAPAIRTQGVVQYPYAEDHDMPFISVADIAAVAAHYLLHPQWAGQWTRNLMGPTNLTLPACTALLSQAWGQPVRYERQSAAALQQTLGQWGLTAYAQQEMTALFQALGDPHGAYATPRTAEAYTPTSFQEFIATHLLPLLPPNQ
ncbi:NAD(P)H-binding protein (plasmid) [Hymenobacter tibetensis]|uniref:NAD(P)H-binding protein n=1 Tax=Hymenobacter tibetensis TaxID=497967 RepID=A0ABY4D8U4_9BACT|nr:NAD(P)H-binding protein [Hymenobacter tibetensis]UOG77636.1 NAD(P)H-binding protein [Hymenobacter tibetensis]